MARYKVIDTGPRFLPVDLQRQLLPGTFEFAVDWIVDHHLDLTCFDTRYRNDAAGACRDHVTFIDHCGDSSPHYTTIADFVSSLGEDAQGLFTQVLWLCHRSGLSPAGRATDGGVPAGLARCSACCCA